MNATMKLVFAGVLVVIMGAAMDTAQAAISGAPAFGYREYVESSTAGGEVTVGWEFSISRPITITALGYYDYGSDGLIDSHQIGIFDASQNLLVSATVAAGSGEQLVGDNTYSSYRYDTNLTGNAVLPAGTYRIGGTGGLVIEGFYDVRQASPNLDNPDPLHVAFPITLGHSYSVANSSPGTVTYPTGQDTTDFVHPWSGPNFIFEVPEPSALAVLGLGGFALLARRRKAC